LNTEYVYAHLYPTPDSGPLEHHVSIIENWWLTQRKKIPTTMTTIEQRYQTRLRRRRLSSKKHLNALNATD
jgi:hypothetical protein